jgi:hypothetical protein
MTAQTLDKAWATGVRLNNSNYALVDDLLFRSVSHKGTAVYITGEKDNVSNVIRHLKVVGANKGAYCDSDYTEGTSIFEPDIIDTNRAVEFGSDTNNPQLIISGGHLNVLEYAIKTRNVTDVLASNLLIYATHAGAIGVSIDDSAGVVRGHSFSNVTIFGNSTGKGYEFTASTDSASILGGTLSTFPVGVDVADGCDNIYVSPETIFRGVATEIQTATFGQAPYKHARTLRQKSAYAGDLNDLAGLQPGLQIHQVATGATNTPSGAAVGGSHVMTMTFDATRARQVYYDSGSEKIFSRRMAGGVWSGAWSSVNFEEGFVEYATNADYTTPANGGRKVLLSGAITADRTVTLATAAPGTTFEFTRTGSGAFNWSIGGLKNLAENEWCRVTTKNGSEYFLAAFGSL